MLTRGSSPGLIQLIHLEWGWEVMNLPKLSESCVNLSIFLGTRITAFIEIIKLSVLEPLS